MISIITIGAFMAAAYKIIPGLVKIVNLNNQVKTYSFTANKIGYRSTKNALSEESCEINSIELRKLSFTYNEQPLLKDVNLLIHKGEMIGIASSSGKGKSTLLNLLLGFLDPSEGNILINGKYASSWERQQYWNRVSYVKQQPFLIHNSILTNITLQEEEPDHELLDKAVDISGLNE